MPSELTFNATESFRKKLLVRNLPPYNEGFKPTELSLNDSSVIDSGNVDNVGNIEENRLFLKNKYGPEDGFGDVVNIKDVQTDIEKRNLYYTFIASIYNPIQILTNPIPNGSNGNISQDSDLAKIAANQLKTEFGYRIGEEIYQQTLGRINILDALDDPFDALAIATGNEQVIESDWKISVPDNVIGKGLDFISRISGVYSPYSWIPGSYFNEVVPQSKVNQASNEGGNFNKKGTTKSDANKRASEQFLSNTGRGQTKRLFKNLELNLYAPDYTDNSRSFGLKAPQGNYYIGSKERDPSNSTFPENQLPIDQFGNKVKSPVKGYTLGEDYESEGSAFGTFKFGLNGTNYLRPNTYTNSTYDTPRLQGGFTWTNTEGADSGGRRATAGGDQNGSVSPQFTSVESAFASSLSLQNQFREGSILDDTQKLIDAAENLPGDTRLKHAGNAINQVSKVFNDGTREMTKGSRVYKYTDSDTGRITGLEYCRTFTKDIPYFSNSELQKTEGMVDNNRRFSYSVLNNTYNLNIAPWRNDNSSNLTGNDFSSDGVKKYMFSIENLAWRTSSKKGFTYDDLAACEKGPNGGRIMWFPPYDLKVSEQNSTNWTSNEFLGRPEPIYTYNNTTRQGNLSWKIVVDHPSILNAIVDKKLSGEDSQKVNDIIDSFFSGCRTEDPYELAKRYDRFTPDDIYEIITTTTDVVDYEYWSKEFEYPQRIEKEPVITEYTPEIQESDYKYEFYFDNDKPNSNSWATEATEDYGTILNTYIVSGRTNYILEANSGNTEQVIEFYNSFISKPDGTNIIENKTKDLVRKIKKALEKESTVNITLVGSASAPNSTGYNVNLSKRRIDSIKKYLLSFEDLSKYQDKLNFIENAQGEETTVTPGGSFGPYKCTEPITDEKDKTYSAKAMACRAVIIQDIEEIPQEPDPESLEPEIEEVIIPVTVTGKTEVIRKQEEKTIKPAPDIAKKILRRLLSECDYFDMMNETTPRVYQGIKEKIKYFHPAFHSMTPEGLNSRLTFLQQCLRPGDTIPVIGEDGKPTQGGVKNTAFGAPPICVLRIGDFYHTKIAIQQISINYEPLQFDLNPEGIGVQPMLADINMSFYFIGGQGLKEPVARLQNALSFNYYGNTEVYDDRAVPTEDRTEIDREFIEQIEENRGIGLTDTGEVERSEEANDTIGTIIDTNIEGNDLTGNINYKNIVNNYVDKTETYVEDVVSSLDTINRLQSQIGLYYFTQNRNYNSGTATGYLDNNNVFETSIFGKPFDIETLSEELRTKSLEDIDNNTNPFLTTVNFGNINSQGFKESDIKKFKKNLKAFVEERMGVFQSIFNESMVDLIKNQTELVRIIDKLNLILTDTDGYKTKSGRISILELSGTTEVDPSSSQANTKDELLADVQKVASDLQVFYDRMFGEFGILEKKNNLYEGFLPNGYNTEGQTRFCTIAYLTTLNAPEYLKSKVLGETLKDKPNWVNYVNKVIYGTERSVLEDPAAGFVDSPGGPGLQGDGFQGSPIIINAKSGLIDVYSDFKRSCDLKINSFKDSQFTQMFNNYTPFNPDKERKFTYLEKYQEDLSSPDKVNYFNKTYKGINSGPKNKFNEKYTFN
jgi:outer membrane protein OmpA-like peptidoglycan-associated protein